MPEVLGREAKCSSRERLTTAVAESDFADIADFGRSSSGRRSPLFRLARSVHHCRAFPSLLLRQYARCDESATVAKEQGHSYRSRTRIVELSSRTRVLASPVPRATRKAGRSLGARRQPRSCSRYHRPACGCRAARGGRAVPAGWSRDRAIGPIHKSLSPLPLAFPMRSLQHWIKACERWDQLTADGRGRRRGRGLRCSHCRGGAALHIIWRSVVCTFISHLRTAPCLLEPHFTRELCRFATA